MNEKNKYGCIFNIQKFCLHDGPGIRTTVFFKGCPLSCFWCSNPESQKPFIEKMKDTKNPCKMTTVGKYMTVNEIMNEIIKDVDFYNESNGGVTLSGGEVLTQAPFAIELLKELKAQNIHTACETTGYTSTNTFKRFIENIDTILFDLKHYDDLTFHEGTGAYLNPILENLLLALESKKEIIIRIPIIPTFNNSITDAEGFCKILTKFNISEIEILPFHQFGESKYQALGLEYKLKNEKQLHKEDLVSFLQVFKLNNINCLIS